MRYRALIAALVALCFSVLTACTDSPASSKESLTYDEIRGTGLANSCPQISETSRGSIPLEGDKSYSLTSLCLQPTTFFVKEESVNKRQAAEFVATKLMTRYTSSIDSVQGKLKTNSDGSVTFIEEDGIDFQAVTVQLPGVNEFPSCSRLRNLLRPLSQACQQLAHLPISVSSKFHRIERLTF